MSKQEVSLFMAQNDIAGTIKKKKNRKWCETLEGLIREQDEMTLYFYDFLQILLIAG